VICRYLESVSLKGPEGAFHVWFVVHLPLNSKDSLGYDFIPLT
jgi:hypothetical protein